MEEAVKWFRKDAGAGDLESCIKAGIAHADGNGMAQDNAKATREWCTKVAEKGDAVLLPRVPRGTTSRHREVDLSTEPRLNTD